MNNVECVRLHHGIANVADLVPVGSVQQIEALIKCHNDHPVAKFWGVCNDQKWALDFCFREEKKINRKKNQIKAKEERERFLARVAAREAAAAAAAAASSPPSSSSPPSH